MSLFLSIAIAVLVAACCQEFNISMDTAILAAAIIVAGGLAGLND